MTLQGDCELHNNGEWQCDEQCYKVTVSFITMAGGHMTNIALQLKRFKTIAWIKIYFLKFYSGMFKSFQGSSCVSVRDR
jgi:hypothetical protein